MKRRKTTQFLLALSCFTISLLCYAQTGHTLKIYTHLKFILGEPTWLLEVRDIKSGIVIPYLFEFKEKRNDWLAFAHGKAYQITASTLTFGPYAVIRNFCGLENDFLTETSMVIKISGELTPNPKQIQCEVMTYRDSF